MLKDVNLCNKYICFIYNFVNFLNICVFIIVEDTMSYSLNSSFVNKQEADALKDMIFRRARERAQALNEDVQEDVMELARTSFVSKHNPFSQIVEKAEKANPSQNIDEVVKTHAEDKIGFPPREPKPQAIEQTKVLKENITTQTIQNTMAEARETLSNKKSFIGALDFLNSQAAVSLMRTRSDKFEAIG